jgi:hypothetical protein
VQQFCTLGSVRGAVTVGYGEAKRARCRKRPIQPRGYLRTRSGCPYSEAPNSCACDEAIIEKVTAAILLHKSKWLKMPICVNVSK